MSIVMAGLVIGPPQSAQAQFQLTGGNVTMTISTAVLPSQPTAVANSVASVRFRRQAVITKLTVQTTCPGQKFNLKVLAVAPGSGTAAPEVTLQDGMPAADFVTGIPVTPPNKNFTVTLQYTASATFAQGNSTELGNDVHTVVYTQVAQ